MNFTPKSRRFTSYFGYGFMNFSKSYIECVLLSRLVERFFILKAKIIFLRRRLNYLQLFIETQDLKRFFCIPEQFEISNWICSRESGFFSVCLSIQSHTSISMSKMLRVQNDREFNSSRLICPFSEYHWFNWTVLITVQMMSFFSRFLLINLECSSRPPNESLKIFTSIVTEHAVALLFTDFCGVGESS